MGDNICDKTQDNFHTSVPVLIRLRKYFLSHLF